MDKGSESEKRRIPRVWTDFDVIMARGKKRFYCQALQLSQGGVLLNTQQKELIGKEVRLELVLDPSDTGLRVSGTVRYVVPSGIGARFEGLISEQRELLQAFLEAHGSELLARKQNVPVR
jgi:hypothetical protein